MYIDRKKRRITHKDTCKTRLMAQNSMNLYYICMGYHTEYKRYLIAIKSKLRNATPTVRPSEWRQRKKK